MTQQCGDYPLPKHACYIWHAGDGIRIGLPPIEAGSKGHSVFIPLSRLAPEQTLSGSVAAAGQGVVQLLALLRDRASAKPAAREEIGRSSAITQDQLERAMKASTQGYQASGLPKEADLRDLGDLF